MITSQPPPRGPSGQPQSPSQHPWKPPNVTNIQVTQQVTTTTKVPPHVSQPPPSQAPPVSRIPSQTVKYQPPPQVAANASRFSKSTRINFATKVTTTNSSSSNKKDIAQETSGRQGEPVDLIRQAKLVLTKKSEPLGQRTPQPVDTVHFKDKSPLRPISTEQARGEPVNTYFFERLWSVYLNSRHAHIGKSFIYQRSAIIRSHSSIW